VSDAPDIGLRRALEAIAATERLELGPAPPGTPVVDVPDDVVRRAGERAAAALEVLAREATPTGRVRAVMLLAELAPERARPHLARMLDDTTPIVVNTCLVGFRRTSDWARWQLGVAAPPRPATRAALAWLLPYAILAAFIALVALVWIATR